MRIKSGNCKAFFDLDKMFGFSDVSQDFREGIDSVLDEWDEKEQREKIRNKHLKALFCEFISQLAFDMNMEPIDEEYKENAIKFIRNIICMFDIDKSDVIELLDHEEDLGL